MRSLHLCLHTYVLDYMSSNSAHNYGYLKINVTDNHCGICFCIIWKLLSRPVEYLYHNYLKDKFCYISCELNSVCDNYYELVLLKF